MSKRFDRVLLVSQFPRKAFRGASPQNVLNFGFPLFLNKLVTFVKDKDSLLVGGPGTSLPVGVKRRTKRAVLRADMSHMSHRYPPGCCDTVRLGSLGPILGKSVGLRDARRPAPQDAYQHGCFLLLFWFCSFVGDPRFCLQDAPLEQGLFLCLCLFLSEARIVARLT